jgi:hypothetical protein
MALSQRVSEIVAVCFSEFADDGFLEDFSVET